ncbi:MAG: hypothetical protein AAGI46_16380, partial [Planctomycetota bacterium]
MVRHAARRVEQRSDELIDFLCVGRLAGAVRSADAQGMLLDLRQKEQTHDLALEETSDVLDRLASQATVAVSFLESLIRATHLSEPPASA